MNEKIEEYKAKGFREIPTDSGTGSVILVCENIKRAVKFNFDPSYDRFVSIAKSRQCNAFPKVYLHEECVLASDPLPKRRYTLTELELLIPLSLEEQGKITSWVTDFYAACSSGLPLKEFNDDPYSLLEAVNILLLFARDNNLLLDLGKGTNFMARQGGGLWEVVIIDPFN